MDTNSLRALELEYEQTPTLFSSSSSSSISSLSSRRLGGWRSIKYIIGNESFEKLASMSLISNLTVYLLTNYNLNGIFVVNVVQIWSGSSNIFSIIGAFISDTYLGRYQTLLYGCISSLLPSLSSSSFPLTPPSSHAAPPTPPPPFSSPNLSRKIPIFHLSSLSHPPSPFLQHAPPLRFFVVAERNGLGLSHDRGLGPEQGEATAVEGYFNRNSYSSFTIALVIALTGVVYIQTNISWTLGFAIPTGCLAFSITIFLLGRHTYIFKKPQGSVFSDMAKVIAAAYKKRHIQAYERTIYNPTLTLENTKLVQTDRFKFLDKAAIIVDPSELNDQGMAKNDWRLCSLKQVEHFKCLLGILPVWVVGICCFIVMDQQNTFGVLQAIQTNRSIGSHFKVPPGWMNLSSRLTMVQRIRIGILLSILCLNETFAAVAIMEFFTLQMSESMRTVAGACFFFSLSVANYLGSLIVSIIHKATSGEGNITWIGGHDLNENRLEYYYYFIAALGALNFLYFNFFASRYLVSVKDNETT
ncbi:hypothetical protein Fmac_000597 [Flemingia macrophylla]|uniref:NPF family transporter n=1 Tax=Flemingia macrophylla TaxID=520843 RepID=A0ABD1NEP3_9FABA